ncbi:MAG: hypothetical protein AB7E55_29410, partial [Pigmentiphaga sp.]
MKAADLGIIPIPRPVPTWPGPSDLLPHYSAGWDAYGRYEAGVQAAWLDAQARGMTEAEFRAMGYSIVADPDTMAPVALAGGQRAAWCMGWCEHMVSVGAMATAISGGVNDGEVLWQIAVAAVQRHRATYLP